MFGLTDDIRHTWRVYRRTPLQSGLAILTLGVAIAFATAFFSLYSDLSFRTLPGVEDSTELSLLGLSEGGSFDMLRSGMREVIREESTALQAVEGFMPSQFEIDEPDYSEPVAATAVTAGYFTELGVGIAEGRPLDDSDSDALAVVISDKLARDLFGEAAGAINQDLVMNEMTWQVVGVAEPGFQGLIRGQRSEMWLPRDVMLEQVWSVPEHAYEQIPMQVVARLNSGVSVQAAQGEVRDIASGFPAAMRSQLRGQSIRMIPALSTDPEAYRATQQQLRLMSGAAILVALIAGGNLGLFLLARAPARQREMALRLTVGARPARLIRQLMTEASVLVIAGTLIGFLAALWLGVLLQDLPIFEGGRFLDSGMDWRIPLFALGMAAVLAMVVGTAPAVGLARQSLAAHSRDHRQGFAARHVIATVQVMLAMVIVAGGLYAQHSLRAGLTMDPGYDRTGLSVVTISPGESFSSFEVNQDQIDAYRAEIRERLEGLGSIQAMGFADVMPGSDRVMYQALNPLDDPDREAAGFLGGWDPAVMEMLGLRLLQGSLPESSEQDQIVVNRELAERFWGRSDVVGEYVERDAAGFGTGPDGEAPESEPMEIVAVVDNIHFGHPRETMRPMALRTIGGRAYMADLIIQGDVTQAQLESAIGDFLAEHRIPMQIQAVTSLEQRFEALFEQDRSRAWMTGLGAVIVLIMAVLGFYGTLRFLMQGHRFEFALRAALGAGPRELYRQALARGLWLAVPGLMLGLPVTLLILTLLGDYLAAVDARVWPATFAGMVLLTAALLLAIHPIARQASRQDPGPALRGD